MNGIIIIVLIPLCFRIYRQDYNYNYIGATVSFGEGVESG